jgi:tetrahydrodipicolinate N-succinyltransferase
VLAVGVRIVEICGRRVRVQAYIENGVIIIEMTRVWDPAREKPVVLITTRDRLVSDVKSLVSEIVFLLRELVEKVVEEEERSEVQ